MKLRKSWGISALFALALVQPALAAQSKFASPNLLSLESWLAAEQQHAAAELFANIEPAGTAAGIVVASPSQQNPDYYFHWVRDGSLAMDVVATMYAHETNSQMKQLEQKVLVDFASLSRNQQLTPNLSGNPGDTGLGEPKFNVDGSPFMLAWGRPQNDGAALRALTMIDFAETLLQEGQQAWVAQNLYSAVLPANTVIKADLEYVAHHWQDPSFDLWEETLGDHFYTKMVQRKAMLQGAVLAGWMNDSAAAQYYQQQASLIAADIQRHWNGQIIVATLNPQNGTACGPKSSGLDVAVILGSIQGCAGDGFFCPGSMEVMATAKALSDAFVSLYPINQITADTAGNPIAPAIGRYPEDCYNGVTPPTPGTAGAWFLATNAFAELYYRTAQAAPNYAAQFNAAGDAELRRVMLHAGADGSLSEQYNRSNGYMQSANNLTWSYSSLLTALTWRP